MAQMATVKSLHELAEAFSDLASLNPAVQANAAKHFVAAAKFAALAAAATIAASFVPASGNNAAGQSSPEAPSNLPPTPATTAGSSGQATPTVNVVHLAAGGLITQPTLAIVGDSISSARGGAREAVLPLDDANAMSQLSSAVAERLRADIALPNPPDPYAGLEKLLGIQHHYHIKGDVIDHTNLMRKQSRLVKRGRARLTTTTAFNLNRRA